MLETTIDNINIFQVYGVGIESGLKSLTQPAELKATEEYDWPERHGKEYFLTDKVNDTKVVLKCWIKGNSLTDFMSKKDAFEAMLRKPVFKILRDAITSKEYTVKYDKISGFDWRTKNTGKPSAKFNLELTIIQDPLNQPSQTTILDGNGDGEFYQGMNYKNVASYAAMIAAGVPAVMTTYKVAVDEVKGMENTTYQRWPDGSITWVASVEES